VAKFAIAKQKHQDGITENQVIITSCGALLWHGF
jgi:hypothetical protein